VPPLFLNAIVFGALAGAVVLAAPGGRRRGLLALGVALIGGITGFAMGALVPSDLWRLPVDTGLALPLALMLGQAALGVAAVAAGRPWLPGPAVIVAPLTGALVGEIGGALLLAGTTEDRSAKARLALGAAAGGLLGRLGDPALLIVGPDEATVARLAPLALVALLAARPRQADLAGAVDGDKRVTAIALGAGLLALVPGMALPAVWGGALLLGGLALLKRRGAEGGGPVDLNPLLWAVGATALVLVATAAGTPMVIALGIEEIQNAFMAWGPAAFLGAGAGVSALVGGHGASILAQAVLDRSLGLAVPGAVTALTVGLAVGGLGPLIAVGAVRKGLLRWLLQVALVAAVSLWLL
jgi:hypothetical protein